MHSEMLKWHIFYQFLNIFLIYARKSLACWVKCVLSTAVVVCQLIDSTVFCCCFTTISNELEFRHSIFMTRWTPCCWLVAVLFKPFLSKQSKLNDFWAINADMKPANQKLLGEVYIFNHLWHSIYFKGLK